MKYLILFVTLCWAASPANTEDRFFAVPFVSELPDVSNFTSILQSIEMSNKRYAALPIQFGERSVGVIWGQNEQGKDKFWVMGGDGGGLVLQSGVFRQVGDIYWGEIDLYELGAANEPSLVDVRLDLKQSVIKFRFCVEDNSSHYKGGLR